MIWEILLIAILLGFALVLFTPFYVEIDSNQNLVMLRWYPILYVKLLYIDHNPVLRLRIGRWHTHYNLLEQLLQKNKTQIHTKQNKQSRLSFHKLRSLLKTFTITKFKLHVDLSNNEWNGLLFTLCLWVAHRYQLDVGVNFKQENVFQIQLKNNMAQLLWAYLFK